MVTNSRPPNLIKECQDTAKICGYLSRVLNKHANSQKTIQHLLRTMNFIVGLGVALATLLALVPSFQALTGQNVIAILALIAAFVLIGDAALPSVLSEPNPERFKDYALYIRSYTQELKSLENDVKLDAATWEARVVELVRLARMNLDDVFRNWPWLVKKVQACGCNEYWEQ